MRFVRASEAGPDCSAVGHYCALNNYIYVVRTVKPIPQDNQ